MFNKVLNDIKLFGKTINFHIKQMQNMQTKIKPTKKI